LQLDKALKEINIFYWLEYGTLLGVVRDNKFIKHDSDIDIGLFLSDYSSLIDKTMIAHGFIKIRSFYIDDGKYGIEETYSYLGVDIDFFYFSNNSNGKFYSHAFKNIDGKTWAETIDQLGGMIAVEFIFPYYGFKKIDFLGKSFNIPKYPNEHLKTHYGNDFMNPKPQWNAYNDSKNMTILSSKVGVIKKYE
jgi:phosphorylcholine metabolism protein LicD